MTDLRKRLEVIPGLDRLWSPDQRLRIFPFPEDERINPFYKDGFRPYGVMGCDLSPHQNIKTISVLGIFLDALERGKLVGVEELVEATSGNTGIAMLPLATCVGIKRVTLIINQDLADGKRGPLELSFSGKLTFKYPEGNLSGIATARRMGGGGYTEGDAWKHNDGVFNLDQYGNPKNALLHELYTGPEILKAIPDVRLYIGATGTGGTTIGIMNFLRRHVDDVKALGVFCAPGEKLPGVRDFDRMKEITLPWRESIDASIEVTTRQGYLMSLWLVRLIGEMFGPSGAGAYAGGLKFIKSSKENGTLDDLRVKKGPNKGLIPAAIMIPDNYRPYMDHYKSNLTAEQFNAGTSPLPTSLLW